MRSKNLRLFEFAPSKTVFNQILNDTTIRMGFECEMITDIEERQAAEPDEIDYDSRSWSEVEDMVHISRRTRDRIQEEYFEWLSDRAHKWLNNKWSDEEDEYTLKWCIENGHLEPTEEARTAAGQDVDDIIGSYRDDARDEFNDEYREEADDDSSGDMDDFISDEYGGSNTRLMNAFDIDYDTYDPDSDHDEETDVQTVYNDMARNLRGVVGRDVEATTGLYHNKNMEDWHIEEDGSLEGDGYVTAEVSSAVYPLEEGLRMLQTTFKWMNRNNYTTNNSTGLHVSFSIEGFESADEYDFLKMMVLFDENYTAYIFDRLDAGYAQQMRDVLFKNFQKTENPVAAMSSRDLATTIVTLHRITSKMQFDDKMGPGMSKYFTFRHRANGVVEFRSMGGTDYENKFEVIRKRIVNMAYLMKVGSSPTTMAREYITAIYKMLTSGKFKTPELGTGKGRAVIPYALSTFQTIFDRNPRLAEIVEKHPLDFLQKLAWGIQEKTINIGPQQTRQLRFWLAKMKIQPEAARSAFQDDVTYNIIANLMRWQLVVPGQHDPAQQTLAFAQHGNDQSGAPNMAALNPDNNTEETYADRYARQQRERSQGNFGGDFNRISYRD